METVDLAIDWPTWWKIVAAIVVGCAVYDWLMWSLEELWHAAKDVARWVRRQWDRLDEYRAEKPLWQRLWGRIVEADFEAKRFIPEVPEQTPDAVWVVNKATNALHLATCPKAEGISEPWHWATTLPEARHWAAEQELRTGCGCKPLRDHSPEVEPQADLAEFDRAVRHS